MMADEILDNGLEFDLPKNKSSIIKVIGVGGGGSNAVNHMKRNGINGVDFVVCNTDAQALEHSEVENRIQLGANLTEGLGAGANPEVGRRAAEETRQEIIDILKNNTKMVFITAGMGGGTGTGAAPVLARLAKEMNILTVGIVTRPFKFEGRIREKQAIEGIEELRKNVDSLIVINNDKLREVYGNLSFRAGFAKADEVLATAAKGIAEVITYHFTTNIDLKDVRTVLENSGTAIMGSGHASGENRAQDAVAAALDSPLLNDNHIEGATNVLLMIISSDDENEITMDEMSLINEYIQREAGGDTNVIMGIGIDPLLTSSISVTVIATGFPANRHDNLSGRAPKKIVHPLDEEQPITKAVFDKSLTELDAPSKPMRKKTNTQPDLFSSAESTDKVIHGLYEVEEEEESHAPTEVPKTDLPLHAVASKSVLTTDDAEATANVSTDEDTLGTIPQKDEMYAAENTLGTAEPEVQTEREQLYTNATEDEFALDFVEEDEDNENQVVFTIQPTVADADLSTANTDTLETDLHAETEAIAHDDDMTFELDDIEGDGIYIDVNKYAAAEEDAEEETDYDPFDLRINDVLFERDSEPEMDVMANTPEESKEQEEHKTAESNTNGNKRIIHTLDDYRELEKRLQIKTAEPVEQEATPAAKAEVHEDEELLQFEVKTKEAAEGQEQDDFDLINKPITAALHQKIMERKHRLEAFNYKFKHATSAMLEKEPAYKRQGIEVGSDNYSSQSTVGRMSLGGENGQPEIRTNNSFLHDNVD